MRAWLLALMIGTGILAGCPAPTTPYGRAQEAVRDFVTHTRFLRMEVANDLIAPEERAAFSMRHKAWGSQIRIADMDLNAVRLLEKDTAEAYIRIAWFRPDENDLHVTTIKQSWKDRSGTWMMVGEERVDGDSGVFGEVAVDAPASAPRPDVHRPTVRIKN
jgi:hypothetical protein